MGRMRCVTTCLVLFLVVSAASAREYRLHVLDGLPQQTYGAATDINDSGQVVGFSGTQTAVMWTGAAVQNLGFSVTYGDMSINDQGDVVGGKYLWQDGVKSTLPGILSYAGNTLYAINNLGQIVGRSTYYSGTNFDHASLWDASGYHDLGLLSGDPDSTATDINDSGLIVGASNYNTTGSTAVMWENGQIRALQTALHYQGSYATAVNNAGVVVGYSISYVYNSMGSYFLREACLWQNGILTEIPILDRSGCATDVNDFGQVVGWSDYRGCSGTYKAYTWENGELTWLEGLGGDTGALAINNNGWVVGRSTDSDGYAHAVLWEPIVPEPCSLITLLCGIAAVGYVRKRATH